MDGMSYSEILAQFLHSACGGETSPSPIFPKCPKESSMNFEIASRATGLFAAAAIGLSVVAASTAGASAKEPANGCPALGSSNRAENSGMTSVGLLSPEEAVALSVAQITDAWYEAHGFSKDAFIAERLAFVASLDKNGDGLLCVAITWGQNLNPNSHWAEIEADLLSPPATERWAFADNHNGTSNKR